MNLKSILVLILVLVYGALCWKYYVCNIKNLCPDEMKTMEITHAEPIRFYKNSVNYSLGNFETYADSIYKLSQTKNLEVVGYYSGEEENSSEYENLGLARANVLRELFIHRGLDSNKLIVFSELRLLSFTDSLASAAKIDTAAEMDMNSKDIQVVTHHGISEIYFPTNSKTEIKSAALDEYLKSVVQTSKDKKIRLVGHTDNIGEEEANKLLSLNRTKTVRDQLIKLGMPLNSIECEGKGSSSPKVNNSTEENRALNRRVELIVQ